MWRDYNLLTKEESGGTRFHSHTLQEERISGRTHRRTPKASNKDSLDEGLSEETVIYMSLTAELAYYTRTV